jgi:hypothetical protein
MSDRNGKHLNAVTHGAFAKIAVLPGENTAEFDLLHSLLIREWSPVGITEQDAVLSIAKGIWCKLRAQKLLQARIDRCRLDPNHPLYDEAERVRTFLQIMENPPFLAFIETEPELVEQMYDAISTRILPVHHAEHLRKTCPRTNFRSGSEWLRALRKEITSTLLASFDVLPEPPDHLLVRAAEFLTPDVFKQELGVDERIDAMIDRAVKRLVQTKAIKQMLADTSHNRKDK